MKRFVSQKMLAKHHPTSHRVGPRTSLSVGCEHIHPGQYRPRFPCQHRAFEGLDRRLLSWHSPCRNILAHTSPRHSGIALGVLLYSASSFLFATDGHSPQEERACRYHRPASKTFDTVPNSAQHSRRYTSRYEPELRAAARESHARP